MDYYNIIRKIARSIQGEKKVRYIPSKTIIPDIYSLLETMLQQMGEGAIVFSKDGKILNSNHISEMITGYSEFELHCMFFSSLLLNQNDYLTICKTLEKETQYYDTVQMVKKSGESYKSKIKISKAQIGQSEQLFLMLFENSSSQNIFDKELMVARNIYENVEEAILYTDHKSRILYVNPAFEITTGYSKEEVLGKNPSILQSGYHKKDFYKDFWKAINEHGFWKGEIWNKRKNGEIYPEWLTISTITNKYGDITNYVSIFSDITVHKQNEEQIQKLANYDVLTGTANRYLLMQEFQRLIDIASKHNQMIAVLFLDLDRFKVINETLGHHFGDLLLKKVSSRIKWLLKKKDLIARFGGDEFVILLPNIKHEKEAVQIANDIITALKEPFFLKEKEVYATTSIGIAVYPVNGEDPDLLVKNAAKGMYHAKSNGRNNFELYFEELHPQNHSKRMVLENRLRKAIKNEELSLHYQPQVELNTGNIIGIEALLRWNNQELGTISPGEFIPIAEESGLIIPISEWVINQACKEIKQLHQVGHNKLKVSINISGLHFNQNKFVKDVCTIIRNANMNPDLVELELTESVIMPNAVESIDELVKLKENGMKISIDDFGTGYSSLSYLQRFPIDVLKIDQSFIRNLTLHSDDAAIVRAIIMMAKSLQLEIIAEGVENKEQLNFLRQEKCDIIQGFYVSKPLPFSELEEFLNKWKPEILIGK